MLLTVPLIPVFMVLVGQMSATRRRRRWFVLTRLAHRFLDVVAGLPTLRAYGRRGGAGRDPPARHRRLPDRDDGDPAVAFLSALVLGFLATISVALVAVGVGLRLAVGA